MKESLIRRYRFFKEHAGYRVGYRAVCALSLARAEERGDELGLVCKWEDEFEPWDGEEDTAPKYNLVASVPDIEGGFYVLASLGMIGLNSLHDPYMRVVKAELFAEALDTLDNRSKAKALKAQCETLFTTQHNAV